MQCEGTKIMIVFFHSGVGVPSDKIWQRLMSLANETNHTDLSVVPTMFGERHAPDQRASVSNITPLNTTLGKCHTTQHHTG